MLTNQQVVFYNQALFRKLKLKLQLNIANGAQVWA